jgi:hypothetical protein
MLQNFVGGIPGEGDEAGKNGGGIDENSTDADGWSFGRVAP